MSFATFVGRMWQIFVPQDASAAVSSSDALSPADNKREAMAFSPPDASWLGLHDAYLSGWFQNDTNEVFKGLSVGADDVVLDVGCGNGGVARFCATRGAAIILADSDAEKVRAAERNLADTGARSIQTIISDSNPLPLADGVASVVISTEVLEHVADPAQVLSELVRVGRPGARYLLTVPDPAAESLQKQLAPPSYFAEPNHIRIIQRDEFARMVADAGLVIETRASYGFFWALWWLMFWACDVDLDNTRHPALDHWTAAWEAILKTRDGLRIKAALDGFMPKSQVIVARKP